MTVGRYVLDAGVSLLIACGQIATTGGFESSRGSKSFMTLRSPLFPLDSRDDDTERGGARHLEPGPRSLRRRGVLSRQRE